MSRKLPPNVSAWLTEPLSADVARAVERLARAPDVARMALMPDIHLASEVCVGTVIATRELIYPAAVGGDIGCGIAVVALEADERLLAEPLLARELLTRLRSAVPVHRHPTGSLPHSLLGRPMSDSRLESVRRREGTVQFGTLGRGNHFLEFQADDEGCLWLMVHSGSRAVGQAIRDHHVSCATAAGGGLGYVRAGTPPGDAYLADAQWARDYARANRRAMIDAAVEAVSHLSGAQAIPATYFDCDHNHVRAEEHAGGSFWVHRKGAMPAHQDEAGMLPGSMGTESFHVSGRGNARSLCSSAHGAGRAMSRSEARQQVRAADVQRQMRGVWVDPRAIGSLCEEAPAAYKDVRSVLRAQSDLTRIVRRLRPLLVYKGI